jgi:uncharacterized protein (DUF1501 family)
MNHSVRDMIRTIQREIRDTDLQPDRGAELLTKLTALMGNVADEQREADALYAVVLLRHLDSEEAASRAKIRAETTPEYARKREARDVKELAIELVRSLKQYLRTKSDEMRLTR